MVSSMTVFAFVIEMAVAAIAVLIAVRGVRTYIKRRKVFVKTPKLKGRAYLADEHFGTAQVMGYTPLGMGLEKADIDLLTRDGRFLKMPYHKDQLVADNPIHAMAGATPALWKVRGQTYRDLMQDPEKIELEAQNIKMKEERTEMKAKKTIALNEAVLIPDIMMDIIKEAQKPKQQDVVVRK